MNCRRAEELVDSYIAHTIGSRDMEEFLNHIENCSSCYEELETYFIVHEAMKQLKDEETDTILDMKNMLKQDIKNSKNYLQKIRLVKIFGIGMCGIAFFSVVTTLVYAILELFTKM